jgi:two-component system NtrC family response regulator
MRALNLHDWPGNVRELQNRVQRAVIMAESKRVTATDLELADCLDGRPAQTPKEARESAEREIVQEAVRRHRGKITSAAREPGISRPTLYEWMEKLGIAAGFFSVPRRSKVGFSYGSRPGKLIDVTH